MKFVAQIHTQNHGSCLVFGNSREEIELQITEIGKFGGPHPDYFSLHSCEDGELVIAGSIHASDFEYGVGFKSVKMNFGEGVTP